MCKHSISQYTCSDYISDHIWKAKSH
ncbi:AFR533Wp [Eremothecium gossypii ATCC 10895]|uniref:AFR533Wp n=1 Tax=Eremothecium gossypii (strain ATCC 10895 / CBS 109.51 / FGSC 9923 / NRRL Y-1056) TaxID=284811 RepID=Q752P0_EREGS|nr:AFR533Wp [Eremothecium gossypii ATCC 10895]AAS53904.1 AFR533Wp [Eremothecium gossypii ATCC 10895]AEY98217.1 FAFR533Wp [Eremothecium gossypii FDAG1]